MRITREHRSLVSAVPCASAPSVAGRESSRAFGTNPMWSEKSDAGYQLISHTTATPTG